MIPVLWSLAMAAEPEPRLPGSAGTSSVSEETPASGDAAAELRALRDELRGLREESRELRDEVRELHGEIEALKAADGPAVAPRAEPDPGESVVVPQGEVVDDDVTAFGQDLLVLGTVNGDATSFGADVHIGPSGVVEGDAVSIGGDVIAEPGATIGGDRLSLDGEERSSMVGNALSSIYHRLVFLLSFAGAGVMVVGLFPQRVTNVAGLIERHPIWSMTVGVLSVGFLTALALLFVLTIIGIPVAFLLVAVLGLAWLVGFVGLCQAIGDRLPFQQRHHGRWTAFLAACLAVTMLGVLPWVGWMLVIGAGFLAVGGAVGSRFGGRAAT